ncbi:hypothetical protein FE249_20920 (plasmid) [Acidiphilium multivorum]|uniref:hypothetical protein n=1 Tax=Acidiphilium multivorum TaxID=62140 RepID=UPI001CDD7962|nr:MULTISPECIES: hypothetical protein [Bacteria]MCT6678036.1 hypothetical protein [Staphylococcus aureus]UBU64079.1 hypothetical protein LDB30_15780 [Acidithiobacillus ferrooxidans]UNC16641.1 hypothetical protein FE249_20920 [Acidiphilium multivorum]
MIKNDAKIKEKIMIAIFSILFLIISTKSFLEISDDIIQISVILGTATLAFMTILISIDHSFGLDGIDPNKLGNKIHEHSNNLRFSFTFFISFLISIIIVKLICMSLFVYSYILFDIFDHLLSMFIGGFFIKIMIQFGTILDMFGFMATGAELSAIVRANLRK